MTSPSRRGTLLFAFDNEIVSYTTIALANKKRIEKHYKHEVVIVSDKKVDDTTMVVEADKYELCSSRHYKDLGEAKFRNFNRYTALDITPFEETILLDVDYLVNTPTVARLWSGQSLKVSKSAFDITGKSLPNDVLTVGESNLSMYWATIVCFTKDTLSKEFFFNWKEVVENYSFYRKLFNLPHQLRNDFAVTIAMYKTLDYKRSGLVDLPVDIPTAFENTKVEVEEDKFKVYIDRVSSISILSDLHVINKRSLACL